jgi:hypothetical protein
MAADVFGRLADGRAGRAWLGATAAVVLAAGLAGCGSSGPAALNLRCSGPRLSTPDTSEVLAGGGITPVTPTTVPGVPQQVSSSQAAALNLPDDLDPADPGFGYTENRGSWNLSMVSGTGDGQSKWTVKLHGPKGVATPEESAYAPVTYSGYAVATGGDNSQFITAVSASGRQGAACLLPGGTADIDLNDALLPHAGVLVLQNPIGSDAKGYWLDGYSTSTGQRLWSVPGAASAPGGNGATFLTDGDTVYVWQAASEQIAAYNGRTGQHLWSGDAPGAANPVVAEGGLLAAFGGRVYGLFITGSASEVAALNGASGAVEWKHAVPSDVSSRDDASITQIGGSEVLLGNDDNGQQLLLSAGTGAVLARTAVSTAAAVDNDALAVCYPGGQLAVAIPDPAGAIRILSADQAYDRTITIPPGKDVSVGISRTEAYVFPANGSTGVSGYDLATGKVLWTEPTPGGMDPSGTVLAAFDGGFLLNGSSLSPVYR